MSSYFSFSNEVLGAEQAADKLVENQFISIDEIYKHNQQKVLAAFTKNRVSEQDFIETTGYGYNDHGRETIDKVFADIVDAESAIVRHNFVSGTHTLAVGLFGILRPGDTMLCVTGTPYDTIHSVIGIREGAGSLKEFKVNYKQVELKSDGIVDTDMAKKMVKGVKLVYIQRSRGYSLRASLRVSDIEKIITQLKTVNPDAIYFVDNCYGEFVEKTEPTSVGADIIAGSLIKNPGGGIAKTGGYIAGRADLVELCAQRLTAPGVGSEVGCTLGQSREMFMGLFAAPRVTAAAVKLSVFSAALFSDAGYECYPKHSEMRGDIITSVVLRSEEKLLAFCRGIQSGSPVDSFVSPEAWDMPGYDCPVVMAAGAFTSGSSIELSADGPMKDPFAVYLQGGIDYYSGKIGILCALQNVIQSGE